ncbi:response regulator [Pleurocapsa sp. PCC 7319]|uniref:response regulator n=1 Tax=Pleurocapsa sp. PCC 7319 TaxID=118161 RepID=UPI000346C0C4|nr:response regulator [Pleurocapsa sp. PCC 7319]
MKSLKILLVEDNLPLAKSTAKLIERLGGHSVQLTDEPKTVFELCTAGEIDIVLMDINLPGASWAGEEVSGADLSRLLKTKLETASIPIILLTAYAMSSERESLLADSQADEFFTKPISDYAALIKAIEQLTEN